MKSRILALLLVLSSTVGMSQTQSSDNTIPIIYPPTKTCDSKLLAIILPPCINKEVYVRNVAKLVYSNKDCPPKGLLTFTPEKLGPNEEEAPVTLTVSATQDGVTVSTTTVAVNEDAGTEIPKPDLDFDKIGKALDDALELLDRGSPCEPSGSFENGIKQEIVTLCCTRHKNPVSSGVRISGVASCSYGATCHFPIFGCPYVASLDAVVSANLGVEVSASYQSGCEEGKYCVNANGTFSIGGGAGATLAAGLARVSLQLVASGGIAAKYCFLPKPPGGQAVLNVGTVNVVGTVSGLWGFVSHQVNYKVFDGWSSPPIAF
jgi:hypothetical protein